MPLSRTLLAALFIVAIAVSAAFAHVPVTKSGNGSLATATEIHDPLKSWALYDELPAGGGAHYFRFRMEEGDRLRLILQVPHRTGFTPGLVIMGPGIESAGVVPEGIEVPEGASVWVAPGEYADHPEYEPFTPSTAYPLVDIDTEVQAAGEYVVAVYETEAGGPYVFALGFLELFSIDEWIMVPIETILIHNWEGQPFLLVLAPLVLTLIIGFALILYRRKGQGRQLTPPGWLGSLAGLIYIGSGLIVLYQMIRALAIVSFESTMIITLILAMLPIILGIALLRISLARRGRVIWRGRAALIGLGILGLFVWAGLIVGPVLAIIAGVLPPWKEAQA